MSDALYLSLWYPNLRLAGLADKLIPVLGEFARYGGEARVYSATVWPVSWHEAPAWQRVWGRAVQVNTEQANEPIQLGVEPRIAVEEALENLHDDYAYEFQIGWSLWELQAGVGLPPHGQGPIHGDPGLEPRWAKTSRLVRVTGFGPLFDEGAYEQDGHIRIDFGSDAPFLEEETELDSAAAGHMAENVRQLVDLTNAVEKASGATARLLWSELGESLAQRLAARLSQGN
jgi:hypothetical protein